MVNATDRRSEQALTRQSSVPLFLAIAYLLLLVIPWVLTYRAVENPHILVNYDSDYEYHPSRAYSLNYTVPNAIDILNTLALVVSLPVLSFLLSRAAIVFSQLRPGKRDLTVRQLFGLADQSWWNPICVFEKGQTSVLLVFGLVLLVLALITPLIRSSIVRRQSSSLLLSRHPPFSSFYGEVGSSPGPGFLQAVNGQALISDTSKRLQKTTGGTELNLWPYCNDQNLTRYYNRTCGYSYKPYDISQSALSNYWEERESNRQEYTTSESVQTTASSF